MKDSFIEISPIWWQWCSQCTSHILFFVIILLLLWSWVRGTKYVQTRSVTQILMVIIFYQSNFEVTSLYVRTVHYFIGYEPLFLFCAFCVPMTDDLYFYQYGTVLLRYLYNPRNHAVTSLVQNQQDDWRSLANAPKQIYGKKTIVMY